MDSKITSKILGLLIWTPLIFCFLGIITADPPAEASNLTMASLLSDKDSVQLKQLVKLLEELPEIASNEIPDLATESKVAPSSSAASESLPLENVIRTLKKVASTGTESERPLWRPIYANPSFFSQMKKFNTAPPPNAHLWTAQGKFRH